MKLRGHRGDCEGKWGCRLIPVEEGDWIEGGITVGRNMTGEGEGV